VNNLAPVADAGTNIEIWEDQFVNLSGNMSTDTPTDILTLQYNWTFDNGTYTGWLNSSETLFGSTQSGDYDITLAVRDNDGEIDIDTRVVTVKNKPPGGSIVANYTVAEDSETFFYLHPLDTISDIPYLFYRWDFGDGNYTAWGKDEIVSHTFTQKGTYTVSCSIRDDDWPKDVNTTEFEIVVYNVEPHCTVSTIYMKSVEEDSELNFRGYGTDTDSDNMNLMYMWDFDDGTMSDWLQPGLQNITHVYTKSGYYQAKLIVKDDDGATCSGYTIIEVENVIPNCDAFDDKYEVTVYEDEVIEFYGSAVDTESDMATLEYYWDFGVDNSSYTFWSSSSEYNYYYSSEGEYKATLFVRDDDGESDSESINVKVHNFKPEPDFV